MAGAGRGFTAFAVARDRCCDDGGDVVQGGAAQGRSALSRRRRRRRECRIESRVKISENALKCLAVQGALHVSGSLIDDAAVAVGGYRLGTKRSARALHRSPGKPAHSLKYVLEGCH